MSALFINNNVIKLDAIASTNEYAQKLLINHDKIAEGTVIWAADQQLGRGQRGNSWESQPGKNLTFSVILYPKFLKVEEQIMISKSVSLGICDFVNSLLPANMTEKEYVKIKWPNDIYVSDKKICGILIENSINSNQIASSIVGIGLNINQVQFSTELPNPTSLKLETGNDHNLEQCLSDLCSHIENRYLKTRLGNTEEINSHYLENLYKFGEWYNYIIGNKQVTAKINGVSKSGKLVLEKEGGGEHECDFRSPLIF